MFVINDNLSSVCLLSMITYRVYVCYPEAACAEMYLIVTDSQNSGWRFEHLAWTCQPDRHPLPLNFITILSGTAKEVVNRDSPRYGPLLFE